MKIVVDMNLSPKWTEFLRARGHSAVHWLDVGNADDTDDQIAEHCRNEGAVVLSQDLDFATLHALHGSSKPSIVQIRSKDLRPATIGAHVAHALTRFEKQLAAGAIVTLRPPALRLTRLPIGRTDDF